MNKKEDEMLDEKLISKHSRWDVDMVESWGKEFSSDMMGFPYNIIDRASHAISYSRATADAKSGKIYIRVPYVGDKEEVDIPPHFREPEGDEYKIFIS